MNRPRPLLAALAPLLLAGCATRRMGVEVWPDPIIPGRQAEIRVWVEKYRADLDDWVAVPELPLSVRVIRGRELGSLHEDALKTDADGEAVGVFTSVTGLLGTADVRVLDPYGLEAHAFVRVVDPRTLDPRIHPQLREWPRDPWLEANPRREGRLLRGSRPVVGP